MPTKEESQPSGKDVFIVYQSHEGKLASLLQELFQVWGLDAFFCREELRPAATKVSYRSDLASKLHHARVAVCLLSRNFRWSPYCQAEVGGAVTADKDMLLVTIPPLDAQSYHLASPVLEGKEVIDASIPDFTDELRRNLFKILGRPSPSLDEFRLNLEQGILVAIKKEIMAVADDYLLNPERRLTSIWPSIDQATPSAQRTIKEAIKTSLRKPQEFDGDFYPSTLTFVGVSLKYSLTLITDALREFKDDRDKNFYNKAAEDKELRIQLIHMDDYSHALHALKDYVDIDAIRANFNDEWEGTLRTWSALCKELNIKLLPCAVHRIDFVPARVGILIDHSLLFEGSCAYQRAASERRRDGGAESDSRADQFRLLVGELEYVQYRRGTGGEDDRIARQHINQFISFFDVYRQGAHNGFLSISRGSEWSEMLRSSIQHYASQAELTLVSDSGSKFEDLIKFASSQGKRIRLYVRRVEGAEKDRLLARFKRWVGQGPGRLELFFFSRPPTFRAALYGDVITGIQLYHSTEHGVEAADLRLIVTKYSLQYGAITSIVHRFIADLVESDRAPVAKF